MAALLMRRILVDHASILIAKRGAGEHPVSHDEAAAVSPEQSADLLALDEALNALARLDPQQSRIVELRFFGGLTIEETAEVMGISPATVKRDWNVAKLWLYKESAGDDLMTPESWHELKELLQSVLEREPQEQTNFLNEACAGDQQLRSQVESLSAVRKQAQAFLKAPALEIAAPSSPRVKKTAYRGANHRGSGPEPKDGDGSESM